MRRETKKCWYCQNGVVVNDIGNTDWRKQPAVPLPVRSYKFIHAKSSKTTVNVCDYHRHLIFDLWKKDPRYKSTAELNIRKAYLFNFSRFGSDY